LQIPFVPNHDPSQEALRQVEKNTDGEPVKGVDLVNSQKLKQKFLEGKSLLAKAKKKKSGDPNK